jgi:hypothetical protein
LGTEKQGNNCFFTEMILKEDIGFFRIERMRSEKQLKPEDPDIAGVRRRKTIS